jgi:uncharacterized protein (DUF4415 family)
MSKTAKRHDIKVPTRKREAAILAAAKSDLDAQPLTATQLAAMVPLLSLRGRPKSASPKLLLSVRYSPEVVAYFKSTGDGWQARMDGVLRNYVSRHSRNAKTASKRKTSP